MKGHISSSEDPDKIFIKKSSHKLKDSGELDVFEAATYFSGYNERIGRANDNHTTYTHKYTNFSRDENMRRWGLGTGRISLDLPIRSSKPSHHHHHHHHQDHHVLEEHEVLTMKEKISNVKHKQPSSPGGRIASFLNSLFHQSGSKKNRSSKSKSKSKSASISHFLSSSRSSSNTTSTTTTTTTTNSSSKSIFSSSGSGFRTPPPCLNTPTKNYREFLNHVEMDEKKKKNDNKDLTWLDEKLKLIETLSEGHRVWSEDDRRETKPESTVAVEDDGAESDSSSDLFELQNFDLSSYGGLPVYETTSVDTIKKSSVSPVSNTRPV